VLAAIDFDDQSRFVADKVGNEVPGRHPKAESIPFGLARSQHLPELFLRFGHLTAERPGAVMGAVVDALRRSASPISTCLRPRKSLARDPSGSTTVRRRVSLFDLEESRCGNP
jgi:hypothetical protein